MFIDVFKLGAKMMSEVSGASRKTGTGKKADSLRGAAAYLQKFN